MIVGSRTSLGFRDVSRLDVAILGGVYVMAFPDARVGGVWG